MKVFFSVGEPSGDLHASRMITALRQRSPEIECTALGGPLMEAAGCRVIYRLTDLAVMGFVQVLPMLGKFFQVYRLARRHLQETRPDLVVLVDFPGFNWWIASAAKSLGIRVVYYMPPQLWAWAPWRIGKVRKYVDRVLCSLPFEFEWYRERGINAELVGHPFFDEVAEHPLDRQFLATLDRSRETGHCVVAILPGSRRNEVLHNFPVQMAVMRRLTEALPQVRFLVANFKEQHRQQCTRMLDDAGLRLPVELHVGKTSEILEGADACLMVSGSVSLEVLARTLPAVVVFKMSRWLYAIGRRVFIKCRYISLPNLIAQREIMPEHIPVASEEQTAARICDQLQAWLTDLDARGAKIREMAALRDETAYAGATARAAALLFDELTAITLARMPVSSVIDDTPAAEPTRRAA